MTPQNTAITDKNLWKIIQNPGNSFISIRCKKNDSENENRINFLHDNPNYICLICIWHQMSQEQTQMSEKTNKN